VDEWTRAILGIARGVLDNLDVDVVLDRVLAAAREVTGARYAALGVLDESRTTLERFIVLGLDEHARAGIGTPPRGRGVLGELIRNPAPLRLADVGADARSYGFPAGHPHMRAFLGVPILVRGEPFGNLYLADKAGAGEFTPADEESVVVLAEFAGVAIDHARRLHGSETRRVELEHTVEALAATIQIARALVGQTDVGAILELVAIRGRALLAARALVIEVERDGGLEIAAGAGELPAGLIGTRLPLEGTITGEALATRASQRLGEGRPGDRLDALGLGALGARAHDGLVVPMVFRGEAYGVLVAVDRLDGSRFLPEHQELLESFAASAASALATARSAALERRRQSVLATEAERGRWARELHDDTLQGLAHLRLLLATGQRNGGAEAMAGAIEQALEQVDFDIASLRSLLADLRPPGLEELGVEAAVRALGERFERIGLQVDVSVDLAFESGRAAGRHPPELETAIYRIVQEALTNASKHGHAGRAAVEIREDEAAIHLSIRDDGAGFDPAAATSGFGLHGMLERVELLDGSLSVQSASGGTTIAATLPAAPAANR